MMGMSPSFDEEILAQRITDRLVEDYSKLKKADEYNFGDMVKKRILDTIVKYNREGQNEA